MNKFKAGLVVALCMTFSAKTQAQYFNGISTSNYMTQSSAYINPAEMSTSASKFSLDFIGFQSLVTMNQGLVSPKGLIRANGSELNPNASGPYKLGVKLEARPFGFKFRVNKLDFALTTRIRSGVNFSTRDGKFLDIIINGFGNQNFSSLQVDQTSLHTSVIGDVGLSVSAPVMETDAMKLYVGGTLRNYQGGIHTGVEINGINYSYNKTTDTVDIRNLDIQGYFSAPDTGVLNNISDVGAAFSALSGKNAGKGFGGDIGGTLCFGSMRTPGDYKLKLGMSITDIGKIRYKQGREYGAQGSAKFAATSTNIDFSNYDSLVVQLRRLGFTVQDGSPKEVSYALPTTLHLSADYAVRERFYVNGYMALSMISLNSRGVASPSFFTVTPRFQSRLADVMVPFTYNMSQNNLQMGLAARFYFFYFGTQDLFGLFAEYPKTASVYAGFSFGFGKGKQNEDN